ncbi:MAG TPA: putative Ig domain-containing protein [Steroidobacteraceae bacterium]|jgi:hypothetical protein
MHLRGFAPHSHQLALSFAVLLSLSLLVLPATHRGAHKAPATQAPATRAVPSADSVGNWLWPGSFQASGDPAQPDVDFVSSGRRYLARLRSDGFQVRAGSAAAAPIAVHFAGAAPAAAQLTDSLAAAFTFLGPEGPRAWARYGSSVQHDLWPGIDARFRVNDGDLELDFMLHAHADPARIVLAATGGTRFVLAAASGDVLATRGNLRFRLKRPRAFQGAAEVAVHAVTDGQLLRFVVGEYDPARPLVIDPLVATYSTFLAPDHGGLDENTVALASDAAGNLYVAGLTMFDNSVNPGDSFPTTPSSLHVQDSTSCANGCGYVLKLNPAHQVVYGALMQGMKIMALDVDGPGQAYITGTTFTSYTFPATPGVFDNDPAGQVFLAKIAADGARFVYCGRFPADAGNGIAVDSNGNAYVVGLMDEPNLHTTPGAIKPSKPLVGNTVDPDGFLLKVSADGSTLLYGTYLGGTGADVANAVRVDAQGEAIVTGQTASADFVGLAATVSGPSDAFLAEVSADGSRFIAGGTLGGAKDDYGTALAADGTGGWLVCGATESADFPVSAGAFQTRLQGQRNGWVRRLDSGLHPLYSTYFGGSAIDGCLGIASNGAGSAYLVGVTFSADLPLTAGAFQEYTSGITDEELVNLRDPFYIESWHNAVREAYFAQLSPDGATVPYTTYLGGFVTNPPGYPPLTFGEGISATTGGTVYVSGATQAVTYPVTDGGLRPDLGFLGAGFITGFSEVAVSITTPAVLPVANVSGAYRATLSASGGTPPYTWSQVGPVHPAGLALSADGVLSGSNMSSDMTGFQFTVKVTDAGGVSAYKSMFLNPTGPGSFNCDNNSCVAWMTTGGSPGGILQLPALARAVPPQSATISGTLPPGLMVSSSGALSGSPTTPGQYSFTLKVSDAQGKTGTLPWNVRVTDGTVAPTAYVDVSPTTVAVGDLYTLTWKASAAAVDCSASGGGADGSAWSGSLAASGQQTYKATQAGTFVFTMSCDSAQGIVQGQITLTVTSASSGGGGIGGTAGGGGGGALGLELGGLLLVAQRRARRRAAARRGLNPQRRTKSSDDPRYR